MASEVSEFAGSEGRLPLLSGCVGWVRVVVPVPDFRGMGGVGYGRDGGA